jgi:hypothetical protein
MRVPATKELILLHQKRREIPEFAKWWARYVHLVFAMKYSHLNLAYTEEELEAVLTRAFSALPPELRK